MGQTPMAGRVFVEGEDLAGAAPVAVLSHHYWRDEMGSRPSAIGSAMQIGREMVTVIGVMRRRWSSATSPKSISGCR
jgi:hypothetical protein